MPIETGELRISLRKLLAGLVLIILPVSLAGLYVTGRSDRLLEQSLGEQSRAVAETGANSLAQFINDRITDCREIASDPAVLDAVLGANKSTAGSAADEKMQRIQSGWGGKESAPVVAALESSPAARVLRRRRQVDPRFLLIIAADERGATVAASDKPATYLQASEPYWDEVYAQGRGSAIVRDAQFDADSHANYIGIAVPVRDESQSGFAGAIYALIDISPELAQLNNLQVGTTAKTVLVKSGGAIISAPNINLSMNLKSEEYVAVQDTMSTSRGRQAGYLVASLRDGSHSIVGFADLSARRDIPPLGWVLMVSQDRGQATAPLRDIERFATLMVILGLLLLTLVAMYFFTHRREEFEEIPVLHEKVTQA